MWGILISHGHSQLAWTFSPCVGHFHLMCGIFTLCEHSHLVWTFIPYVDILTLCGEFSPCTGHSHFVWGIFILHRAFSPRMGILTSHGRLAAHAPFHHHHVNHPAYTLPGQQKNYDQATQIPSMRYLCEPPIIALFKSKNNRFLCRP